MIRAREIRNALAGALLFLVGGMLQACATDALMGPQQEPVVAEADADGEEPICRYINGIYVCK